MESKKSPRTIWSILDHLRPLKERPCVSSHVYLIYIYIFIVHLPDTFGVLRYTVETLQHLVCLVFSHLFNMENYIISAKAFCYWRYTGRTLGKSISFTGKNNCFLLG